MRYLYINGIPVSGLVWGHDTNYFIPDTDGKFYFHFPFDNAEHKIPITPFVRGDNESVIIYETIKSLRPDVVLTVGDYNDFLYMKAVRSFCDEIKWMWVLSNYSSPINENNRELVNSADGILCTSEYGYSSIKDFFEKELIEYCYVGTNPNIFHPVIEMNKNKIFRIMVSGKNSQVDNIPIVIEAASKVKKIIPELDVYIHTNLYDSCGEYDLEQIAYRFDPKGEFIHFPNKCVSIFGGISHEDLASQLALSDVFVTVPLVSATSMSVFDALACGCFPILSNCGSNINLAQLLSEYSQNQYKPDDFLVKCSDLMAPGGTYLSICDCDDLAQKIINAYNIKGDRKVFSQFIHQYTREGFLKTVMSMLTKVKESSEILCLEGI